MKDRQEKVPGPTNGFYSAGLSQPTVPMVAVQTGGQTKVEVVKEKDEKNNFS